jgi:three-Cys-motif partner protein
MKTIDLFLNFPVADMNRNVLWRDPEAVQDLQISRMNSFWGDETWRTIAYETAGNLFGYPEKQTNELVAQAFLHRLKDVAGFDRAPEPLPMRNSKGAIVYYLFFASQKGTAENIVHEIFEKYRNRGEE